MNVNAHKRSIVIERAAFLAVLVTGLIMIRADLVTPEGLEAVVYLAGVCGAWRAGRSQRDGSTPSARSVQAEGSGPAGGPSAAGGTGWSVVSEPPA
jgi:hypothetical protein